MDLDHLKKLVDASIDEGDQLNTDGPEFARLQAYLDKAHCDRALPRIAYGVTVEVNAMLQRMEADRDLLQKRVTFLESEVRRYDHEHQLDLRRLEEVRDELALARLSRDGSKAIVEAVTDAARADVNTPLCQIKIARPNGPSFYLVEALVPALNSSPLNSDKSAK